MTTSANDNLPWEGQEPEKSPSADKPATAFGAQGPRSSLSLGGARTGPVPAEPEAAGREPRDLLQEGATRARNMAHALAMIVLLLAKYVAVKIVWARLQTVGMRSFLVSTRLLQALYVVAKPHLDRLREQARVTTNQVWRAVLIGLIQVIGPTEEIVVKLLGIAKVEAVKLAAKSTRSATQVLAAVGKAIGQAIKAGLTRPAVQKLAAKVIRILEEAQI
jgi:hypothetical protein